MSFSNMSTDNIDMKCEVGFEQCYSCTILARPSIVDAEKSLVCERRRGKGICICITVKDGLLLLSEPNYRLFQTKHKETFMARMILIQMLQNLL